MSPQLLRVCERLAREGYLALAPDLFVRSGGPEAADFATLIGALDPATVLDDLGDALATVRDLGAASVGITGFCLGGLLTYRGALAGLGFAAAAPFYGARIAQEDGEPKCPTLPFFGGDDPYIPVADIEAVQRRHPDTVVYPHATHGFMRDGSDTYDEASARDAWTRLLAFFGQHLR
jgi:carboxymethylenebutenolidase